MKAEIPAKVDSLAAAKLNVVQPQSKLYKGFVKAGFGLYTTPLGELYYDQTRSRKNGFGLHLKHFSSNGGLDDVGPSHYSFNNVDAYYNHFLRNHEVGGRLMYDRRRVSYYGYPSNDSIANVIANAPEPKEDFQKQIYNDIGFAGRIRSLYKDSTLIAHDVGLEVHAYSNLSESRETNVRITTELSKAEQGDRYALGILIDNNAYRGKDSNGLFGEVESTTLGDKRTNGTLVGLTPLLTREGDKYVVRVGMGIYVDAQGRPPSTSSPRPTRTTACSTTSWCLTWGWRASANGTASAASPARTPGLPGPHACATPVRCTMRMPVFAAASAATWALMCV